MAHLREIEQLFCAVCKAKAKVQLYDARNSRYGNYCRKCGEYRLQDLQYAEKMEQ